MLTAAQGRHQNHRSQHTNGSTSAQSAQVNTHGSRGNQQSSAKTPTTARVRDDDRSESTSSSSDVFEFRSRSPELVYNPSNLGRVSDSDSNYLLSTEEEDDAGYEQFRVLRLRHQRELDEAGVPAVIISPTRFNCVPCNKDLSMGKIDTSKSSRRNV